MGAGVISLHPDTQNIGNSSRYGYDFQPVDFGDDLERLAAAICRYTWAPSQWLGDGVRAGRRRQDRWARALYCVLDYDGTMTLAEARKRFCDMIHVIGTTRNHQKAKGRVPALDRFRVVLKFDRAIEDLDTFRASMAFWINRYDADPSCKDAARYYWPCVDIVSVQAEGETVEVIPPPMAPRRQNYAAIRTAKIIPSYLHPLLRDGAPEGARNSTCFKLGAELTRCGFAEGEVLAIVAKAPMGLPPDELRRAVENGIKAARVEARGRA